MNAKADSTGIQFMWQGNINEGTVAGAPAYSTTQIGASDNRVIYGGDWSQCVIGVWRDALEIIVDPWSLRKTGMVEVVATLLADVGVINAAAFAVSTDSGAQ